MTTYRPRTYHRSSGATRIIRDNYGESFKAWRALSEEVKQRDGYRCVFCGSTSKLEVHHITPLSKGGLTVKNNLVTACDVCHDRRHSHLVVGKKSRQCK